MKRAILLTLVAAGCAPQNVQVAPGAPAGACRAERTASLVGKRFDAAVEKVAKAQTDAAAIRLVRPGEMVTMDFRADRLTLKLDDAGTIISATCG